jgi:hypothetical protein
MTSIARRSGSAATCAISMRCPGAGDRAACAVHRVRSTRSSMPRSPTVVGSSRGVVRLTPRCARAGPHRPRARRTAIPSLHARSARARNPHEPARRTATRRRRLGAARVPLCRRIGVSMHVRSSANAFSVHLYAMPGAARPAHLRHGRPRPRGVLARLPTSTRCLARASFNMNSRAAVALAGGDALCDLRRIDCPRHRDYPALGDRRTSRSTCAWHCSVQARGVRPSRRSSPAARAPRRGSPSSSGASSTRRSSGTIPTSPSAPSRPNTRASRSPTTLRGSRRGARAQPAIRSSTRRCGS